MKKLTKAAKVAILEKLDQEGLDYYLTDYESPDSVAGTELEKPWRQYLVLRTKILAILGFEDD